MSEPKKEKLQSELSKLIRGIFGAIEFQGIEVKKITDVVSNAGGVWFKFEEKEYCILIDEAEPQH